MRADVHVKEDAHDCQGSWPGQSQCDHKSRFRYVLPPTYQLLTQNRPKGDLLDVSRSELD